MVGTMRRKRNAHNYDHNETIKLREILKYRLLKFRVLDIEGYGVEQAKLCLHILNYLRRKIDGKFRIGLHMICYKML